MGRGMQSDGGGGKEGEGVSKMRTGEREGIRERWVGEGRRKCREEGSTYLSGRMRVCACPCVCV